MTYKIYWGTWRNTWQSVRSLSQKIWTHWQVPGTEQTKLAWLFLSRTCRWNWLKQIDIFIISSSNYSYNIFSYYKEKASVDKVRLNRMLVWPDKNNQFRDTRMTPLCCSLSILLSSTIRSGDLITDIINIFFFSCKFSLLPFISFLASFVFPSFQFQIWTMPFTLSSCYVLYYFHCLNWEREWKLSLNWEQQITDHKI